MTVEGIEPRATTASIDRRVERLEVSQAETARKVDALDAKMEFMSELMKLRFSSIEAVVGSVGSKLDAFMAKIDAMVADSVKQATELAASPLGRQIDKRLSDLEAKAETAEDLIVTSSGLGALVRQYLVPAIAVGLSAFALFRN